MNKKLVLVGAIAAFSSANFALALSEDSDKSGFSVFAGGSYLSSYGLGKLASSTDGLKGPDGQAVDSKEVKFADGFGKQFNGPVGTLGVAFEITDGVKVGVEGYYGSFSGKVVNGKTADTKTEVELKVDTFGVKGSVIGEFAINDSFGLVGQLSVGGGASKSAAASEITYQYGQKDKEFFTIAKTEDKDNKYGSFGLTGGASLGAFWHHESGFSATVAYKIDYINAATKIVDAKTDTAGSGNVNNSFVHGLGLAVGYAW
ncbi:hypothetical protein Cyrtocomes_00008 [Candidatus Cyrtobacter comes]|uniref:Outer membrane protein beta-barrel domain-containing protein n=1 Tax=Candidatus Cyrtobacter comes TaxID=675776 RepID=A0ABU5L697_9RICK|nr:hypothetical protein [Candidatus Cyrtobacter comes]MDZ5761652.1 hypothetical protein [Candidatus Cyrtobacter comes]